MFSGIIQDVGLVKRLKFDGILHLEVSTLLSNRCAPGNSVSVNGVCLTVTDRVDGSLFFNAVPETIEKTNLVYLETASPVNIEMPLVYQDPIGGHLVQGHVDGVGIVNAISNEQNENYLRVKISRDLSLYLVKKGFIAIDGMSLTVVDCNEEEFSVALIPYTVSHTIAKYYQPGMRLNIEVDMMSKYIKKHVRDILC